MQGIIGFEDLLVRCIIGIHPEERLVEQELLINLQTEIDFTLVAQTDDLSKAISYAALSESCWELVRKKQYHLLETLAVELTQTLTEKFKLSWIKIMIKKPSAIPNASFAYAELEYGKRNVTP